MIQTARQALALLAREGTVTLTQVPGRRSLVAEVAGGPVKGSWWGHEKGALIYRIAEELETSPDVLVTKLIDGKVTFVARALWPALVRVVTDTAWRATRAVTVDARRLLARVERAGQLKTTPAEKRPRDELARAGLVIATSEHTQRGAHASVLRSWDDWLVPDIARAAAALTFDEARAVLEASGIRT